MKIVHDPRGFYTLYIEGRFYGNYDTVSEAVKDYEEWVTEQNV